MNSVTDISKLLLESILFTGHGVNCELSSDKSIDKQSFAIESLKSVERDYENILAEEKNSKDIINTLSLRKNLFSKFDLDKIRLSRYIHGSVNELNNYFDRAVKNILNLNPEKVYFSLSSTDSIDFRIYKNNFEIYLEIFYTQDDEIECIYSIFNNGIKIRNNLGKINTIFSTLNMEINPYQLSSEYKGSGVYAIS
jgi:hypothetical protein